MLKSLNKLAFVKNCLKDLLIQAIELLILNRVGRLQTFFFCLFIFLSFFFLLFFQKNNKKKI